MTMAAPFAVAAASLFTCAFDGFMLTVNSTSYAVASSSSGAPWLEDGSLAVQVAGVWLVPGAGLVPTGAPSLGSGVDETLGAYSFLSLPWATNSTSSSSSSTPILQNFTCYTDFSLASFSLTFPEGLAALGDSGATERPSIHFPTFSSSAGTSLRSPALGFVEWAGEMSSYANAHGTALNGFGGGRESGPLLLFNNTQLVPAAPSRPDALLLGPGTGTGTHLAHQVLGVVPNPATETTRLPPPTAGAGAPPTPHTVPASCGSYAPHTDEVGANSAPGTEGGLLVPAGNATACCAACTALGPSCDSWVFDTDGTAGGSNCWPLLGVTGSKEVGDRLLGLNKPVQCAPQPSTDATGSSPTAGFETGASTPSADACCVLCATLGAAACAAWSYDSSASTCFPLASYSGTAPAPASMTFGATVIPPTVLAAGVQGHIASLPPGFVSSWWLAGSGGGGLSDAVLHYGRALRTVARLERIPKEDDPMRRALSYWSDNGAMYFDGYWPLFFNATHNTAQDVFLALKAYHAGLGLAVASYQMDPWWYGGSCGSDGPPPPQCADPVGWPWAANWSAAPGFFPDGLAALGLPLTLYSNLFAQSPTNLMTDFTWVNGSCSPSPCARVAPSESYDFHSYIFDVGLGLNMNAFEVDFADFMFLDFQDFGSDVRAFDEYWAGLDQAGTEHGLSTQICMSLPAIMLSSVHWPSVTNGRLSPDGYATVTRYDIFQTSLLYSSVEIAPFLDNIWTTSCQPAADNPFGNTTCEGYVEALAAIATLSAGPVGFADHVGFTNATLLGMATRGDGMLLQPSMPAVHVELYYADRLVPGGGGGGGGARISNAPSFIAEAAPAGGGGRRTGRTAHAYPFPAPFSTRRAGGQEDANPPAANLFLTVFGIFVDANVSLAPVDLFPPLPLPPSAAAADALGAGNSSSVVVGYYVQALSRREACVDGAPATASGCVSSLFTGGAADALLSVSTGAAGHEVYSVAPVLGGGGSGGGWALLGELDKFTRVSPDRFTSVSSALCTGVAAPALCATLVGGAGEAVNLTLVDPAGTVRVYTAVLDASGQAEVVCTGAGSCGAGVGRGR
jgi:hypothetical protein